jgi:ATP-dependent Clp protease protease subunit
MKKTNERLVGKDERFDNSKFYLQYGIDLEKRKISISGSVDEDSVGYAIRGIYKMVDADPKTQIDVYINSYGGDAHDAFGLYDVLVKCPCPIVTHVEGKAMSSGFTIFLAGDERYSLPHSTFMAHSASSQTWGKEFQQEVDVKELKRINKDLCKIYEECTGKPYSWWQRKLRTHDFYFDKNLAKELGIVTHEYDEED